MKTDDVPPSVFDALADLIIARREFLARLRPPSGCPHCGAAETYQHGRPEPSCRCEEEGDE